ncbi:zinc transporter ZIP3 [Nephila pilipes]|uniref:Zinc transporter ZIP3 n=1 Tax=Nephila pilipes TaxID=299642 RepID=A0A8X6NSG4_NEPPI|nr:zinc transporter ZIP3 [Nephila pilipes]
MDSLSFLKLWRITFIICFFSTQFTCYFTPILISKYWESISSQVRTTDRETLGSRSISWFNCIAIGIFLGMCFLGLLPDVLNSFAIVFQKHNYKVDFPVAEYLIVLGIFITLLLEQTILAWKDEDSHLSVNEQNQSLPEEGMSDEPTYFPEDLCEPGFFHVNDVMKIYNFPFEQKSGEFRNNSWPHPNCKKDNSQSFENFSTVNSIDNISCHNLTKLQVYQGSRLSLFIFALASGLHSIFEGVFLGLQTDTNKAIHYFIGISVHECIIAIAFGINSARLGFSFRYYLKYAFIYSAIIPVGVLIGIAVGHAPGTAGQIAVLVIQAISAGIFFHVTFLDFIPYEFSNRKDRILKIIFLMLGFNIFLAIIHFMN